VVPRVCEGGFEDSGERVVKGLDDMVICCGDTLQLPDGRIVRRVLEGGSASRVLEEGRNLAADEVKEVRTCLATLSWGGLLVGDAS
jgi:hypothetical protein